jgi:hypothetical protein
VIQAGLINERALASGKDKCRDFIWRYVPGSEVAEMRLVQVGTSPRGSRLFLVKSEPAVHRDFAKSFTMLCICDIFSRSIYS